MEQLTSYPFIETLNKEEQRLVREFRDHNLKIAGEENPFQHFGNFDPYPTPSSRHPIKPHPLREFFEWESKRYPDRIYHITTIMTNEQFIVESNNKGTHNDVWNTNTKVRLHFPWDDEDDEDDVLNRFLPIKHQKRL